MTTSEPSSNGQRRHPAAQCETCPLNYDDCVFVPSFGPEQADVIVVGEAPGYQEAKAGRPFVGPSGKLLDHVLSEAGIDPDSVYRTNVCLCRPPENATPPASAIRACAGRLKSEIDQCRPRKLFLLGNTAAQTVLRTKAGITALRAGPPRHTDDFPDVAIVPTFHPAATLRQGSSYPDLVTDARKLAGKIQIGWEPPSFKVFDDEKAEVALDELQRNYSRIVLDIEVGVDKEQFDHPDRYDMLCIGVSYKPGKVMVIGENACRREGVKQRFKRIIETLQVGAHNGKFDLAGLKAWCGHEGLLDFDTMLASYALDERQGTHALEYLGAEILGAPDWKSEINKYRRKDESYAVVPRDVLYRYNAFDAGVTWLLADYYEQEFEADSNPRRLHRFLVETSNELMYPEMEGVLVDLDYNQRLFDSYFNELEQEKRLLQDHCSWSTFNPNSPKQVKEWLWSVGVDVDSTNVDHLHELIDFGIAKNRMDLTQFAEMMLQWRENAKLYGTYIKGIRKRLYQGRIHPTFLLHGTVSGRISCRNPNLQNIPRGNLIRAQFVPAEGNVFLQGDYSQAELRVMAVDSQDRYLREVFSDPTRDIFDEVGTVLYGPRAAGDKNLRIRTKAYVYGLAYGREAASIAYEFKIPMAEAQRGMNQFLALIPDLNKWRMGIRREIRHGTEDLVTRFGRYRRFGLITRENEKDTIKEALSFYPQSTASDINLSSLNRIRRGLAGRASVRIPVHDSILVECKRDDAVDVRDYMQRTMEETAAEIMGDFVPFPAEVQMGNNWGSLS